MGLGWGTRSSGVLVGVCLCVCAPCFYAMRGALYIFRTAGSHLGAAGSDLILGQSENPDRGLATPNPAHEAPQNYAEALEHKP